MNVLSVTSVASTAERVSRGSGGCTSHTPGLEMAIVSGSLMSAHVSAKSLGEKLVISATSDDKRTEWIALPQMSQIGYDIVLSPVFPGFRR